MGEIIVSILVGMELSALGVLIIWNANREEEKYRNDKEVAKK